MRTRSMNVYPVIDFDEAYEAWVKNKKLIGNGMYVYICGKPLKTGNVCKRVDMNNGCCIHTNWNTDKT
jgi:hypothetical protein